MAISQISMNSVATNPAYTNPYAKIDQSAAAAQGQMNQNAQKTAQQTRTDTVTLSQQAIQKSSQFQDGTATLQQNRMQDQNQEQNRIQNQTQQQSARGPQQMTYQYPDRAR